MGVGRAVVIGAGVGGLVAAIDLARQGLDVMVLERAAAPGGKLRQTEIGGARIDAGPTVFTMRRVFEEIFADSGERLADHLALLPVEVLARHAWAADQRLDLFADIARSADAIGTFAGAAEARGYLAFCARARGVFATLEEPFIRSPLPTPVSLVRRAGLRGLADLWHIAPFASLWKALGEYFKDPRLRQLFGRYATYAGSSPFLAPATLMLIAHVEQDGVWLVKGGMIRLAEALAGLAERQGVHIRTGADAVRIVTGQRRVSGVELAGGELVAADAIVANTDAAAIDSLLHGGPRGGAAATNAAAVARRSLSAVTWAVLGRTDGFDLHRHNVFFSPSYAAEFTDLAAGRLPRSPTVYVCAQDRGEGRDAPGGAERLLCLVNAPANGDSRPATEAEIAECERTSFATLENMGLRIAREPGMTVMTTPQQFHRMFPSTGGALYGQAVHGAMAAFRRPDQATSVRGLYLAGGSTHPGAGLPMAALSGRLAAARLLADLAAARPALRFNAAVNEGGYVWWYVDALSDDGRHAITLIAFIGSVFSPYYAWARRHGRGDPSNHCSLNVALYGDGGKHWAMTERGSAALTRGADWLAIGPSALGWDGEALTIRIEERSWPGLSRISGTVRLHPAALETRQHSLHPSGRHTWQPVAPCARVEVALDRPSLRWSGQGYLDSNAGTAPLETDFARWNWSRVAGRDRTAILYDATDRDGASLSLGLRYSGSGGSDDLSAMPEVALQRTAWRLARSTRSENGARVMSTLEDTPFYARSLVATEFEGAPVVAMHESLSLDRFKSPIVQAMLPFRMPRRASR